VRSKEEDSKGHRKKVHSLPESAATVAEDATNIYVDMWSSEGMESSKSYCYYLTFAESRKSFCLYAECK
jgi:hypothetical protein